MADSDEDDLDIYVTNKSSNIEDELVIYISKSLESESAILISEESDLA